MKNQFVIVHHTGTSFLGKSGWTGKPFARRFETKGEAVDFLSACGGLDGAFVVPHRCVACSRAFTPSMGEFHRCANCLGMQLENAGC